MTPTLPALSFNEAEHAYYLDGAPLPHVTAVLEAAGLINYAFLGDRREVYLARGKAVHELTQRDDEGNLTEADVPSPVRGYLGAWRAFKRDYAFIPRLIEHRVFHEQYRYAGCLDRTGHVRDGTEWLLDLKTGDAPEATRYQLAAYAACLPHPRTRLRRCVELHEDASYRVIAYSSGDYQRDFDVFVRALQTFRGEKR
jgi:hypothetical protein